MINTDKVTSFFLLRSDTMQKIQKKKTPLNNAHATTQ